MSKQDARAILMGKAKKIREEMENPRTIIKERFTIHPNQDNTRFAVFSDQYDHDSKWIGSYSSLASARAKVSTVKKRLKKIYRAVDFEFETVIKGRG